MIRILITSKLTGEWERLSVVDTCLCPCTVNWLGPFHTTTPLDEKSFYMWRNRYRYWRRTITVPMHGALIKAFLEQDSRGVPLSALETRLHHYVPYIWNGYKWVKLSGFNSPWPLETRIEYLEFLQLTGASQCPAFATRQLRMKKCFFIFFVGIYTYLRIHNSLSVCHRSDELH